LLVSDESGYTLPNLPVGPYRLDVRAPGFKNYTQSGIVLQVNNNVQINVTMQIGSVSEQIEVIAATNQVETKENSISHVIDRQRINELPLKQLIITLGAAAYGDSGDTGSKTFYSSTRISVAGGQGNGTAFKIGERYSVQARVDAFNILNHTNFAGAISPAGTVTGYSTLSTNLSASTFGRVQSEFDPRILQFALKFYF
jgi:Carboxypeptidase regulatory-like domain